MRKSILFVCLILFASIVFVIAAKSRLFSEGKAPPGSVHAGNVVIDGKEYKKTSEVVVIPQRETVVINPSDDTSWNAIVSGSADALWRGVYIKDRKVTLSSFCMAQYPVTQELFSKVMGFNPCYFKKENLNIKYSYIGEGENPELRPAETVSWFDAIVFCNILTMRTMKDSDCVYYTDARCSRIYAREDAKNGVNPFFNRDRKGYRLPTEAEWEFAARGGNQKANDWFFAFSGTESDKGRLVYDEKNYSFIDANLDRYGWYRGNSGGVTHEVGTKLPNALGLYDMSGGVWEWLYDRYDNAVYPGNANNPCGPQSGTDRVLRGGSWYEDAYGCCVTRRFHNAHPYIPHFYFGFRYCRSL